jgi:Tfp pilus assembly PilM family ATPase
LIRRLLRTSRGAHLGVSVGEHHIRLAHVTAGPRGFQVAALHRIAADRPRELREAVRRMGCERLPATVALDDRTMTYNALTLPKLSRRELGRVVEREGGHAAGAEQVHAWAVESDGPGGTQEIAVRSMPMETVRLWARNLMDAGLLPHDTVPNASAMAAAMIRDEEREGDDLVFLLDVRDDRATIVACRGGERVYDRQLAQGWGPETTPETRNAPVPTPPAAPQVEPDIEPEGAAEPGLPADADPTRYSQIELEGAPEPDIPTPTPPPAPAAGAPTRPPGPPPAWARIAEEIQRTHLYCKKNLKTGPLVRAVLAGTGARRPGLVAWLSDAIQVPVEPWEAHRDDIAWPEDPDPGYLRALGAAIEGLERRQRFTRMIPPEYAARKVAPGAARMATGALAASLVAGLVGVWMETTVLSDQRHNIVQLQKSVSGARQARTGAADAFAHMEALRVEAGILHRKHLLPFPGEATLLALGRAMPGDAHLDRLAVDWDGAAWHVTARGRVAANPLASLASLSRMVEALGAEPLFRSVRFVPDGGDEDGTPFTLDITLGGPDADELP